MADHLAVVGFLASPYLTSFSAGGLRMCADQTGMPNLPAVAVFGLAFSPDGAWLAIGTNTSPYLRVLSTSDWSLATLSGGNVSGTINNCAFSPNSGVLAVVGSSPYLKLYNAASGFANIAVAGGQPPAVPYGAAFSPDGTKLAVAHTAAPSLTIYNTADWSKITTGISLGAADGRKVAFSPDGSLLAVTTFNAPYLAVYNTNDWSEVTLAGGYPTNNSEGVAFSPDGARLIVSQSTDLLHEYATSGWSKTTRSFGASAKNLTFSADGTKIYICSSTTNVGFTVIDVATWTTQSVAGKPSLPAGQSIAISPTQIVKSVNGAVRDAAGTLASRTVRLHRRDTGALAASATSTGGQYAMPLMVYTGEMQRIVLDDAAGDLYNDLIDRVLPG